MSVRRNLPIEDRPPPGSLRSPPTSRSRRPDPSSSVVILGRPDRPSSIVAPIRNPEKESGDVGQPPPRRPAGSTRSSRSIGLARV